MHIHRLEDWQHSHRFNADDTHGERNTKRVIESDSDNRISDIHLWRVGPHHLSAIISIVTHFPKSPAYYKNLLSAYDEIHHVTVEVNTCEGEPCGIPNSQLI